MDSLKLGSQGLGAQPPLEGPGPEDASSDSANMRAIKHSFQAFTEEGVAAGVDALLSYAHEDCLFCPYAAGNRELHGREEARAFFSEAVEAGVTMTVRPQTFEEHGDEIVVSGSVRVQRPAGGFAESQIRWIYCFRDGLIAHAHWGPRHPG